MVLSLDEPLHRMPEPEGPSTPVAPVTPTRTTRSPMSLAPPPALPGRSTMKKIRLFTGSHVGGDLGLPTKSPVASYASR